jgi:mRNA interferase RelE/StbE
MQFGVSLDQNARKDLQQLPGNRFDTITRRINSMQNGLPGSVKRLTGIAYGYRLRVGDYRILFDVQGAQITIRRVLHRRHAYARSPGQKKKKGEH